MGPCLHPPIDEQTIAIWAQVRDAQQSESAVPHLPGEDTGAEEVVRRFIRLITEGAVRVLLKAVSPAMFGNP